MPDSVTRYINSAIDTMNHYSVNSKQVDWRHLKESVFREAKGALTFRDSYQALALGLKMLDDRHSFFKKPEEAIAWSEKPKGGADKAGKRTFRISGWMLDSIAKITIGSYVSGNPEDNIDYVTQLQALIKSLDEQSPKGWIVDIRGNSGGNMWPMIAGVSPLLPEGKLGSFIPSRGKAVSWYAKRAVVGTDQQVMMTIDKPYKLKDPATPLAVLVGRNTASSGEALLIAFKSRPNTVVIGEPTSGLSTANRTFQLEDGAQLILTTAVFANKNGRRYGSRVRPDIDVSDRWYFIPIFEYSIMVNEAIRWIQSRPQ